MREAGGRVQHALEVFSLGQVIGAVAEKLAGDVLELRPVRQIMLDHDHQLLDLGRDLDDRRQDDHERPLLLSSDQGVVDGLNDFRVLEEAVVVVQEQEPGALLVLALFLPPGPILFLLDGQGGPGAHRRQGVAATAVGGRLAGAGEAQAVGDVPGGHAPVALPGGGEDLALGFIRLMGMDPEP